MHKNFSRATGAAATIPFATAGNLTNASLARKILKDNGGDFDPQLVIDTAAGANFIGLQGQAQMAGTDSIVRQGVLVDTAGMPIRESAQINEFTAGSFTTGTLTSLVRAVGLTTLVTTADYSGGLGIGDVITLAGDANQYVIQAVSSTVITISEPGLLIATAATGTIAITKIASTTRNMCFARSAIVLVARAPATPEEGDLATDRILITDPRSGLTMEFAMYKGYRKVRYEVALAWGKKVVKPEHTALLLG